VEPVLLRIPFSHYCRKAEWGLTQAGIPYACLDVALRQMRHAARANPRQGTVPVLVVGQRVLPDSHDILVWADEHRATAARPLYPSAVKLRVADWERWADEEIGPATRREAYRALHDRPGLAAHYEVPFWFRLPPARRLYLGILKHYKARRFDAADPPAIQAALARVARRLRESGTGYLFGAHPTAADLATAALLEPLTMCAHERGHDRHPDWAFVRAFIERVRPPATTMVRRSRVRERDWRRLEALHAARPAPA
jgi:glutathione S-transferase